MYLCRAQHQTSGRLQGTATLDTHWRPARELSVLSAEQIRQHLVMSAATHHRQDSYPRICSQTQSVSLLFHRAARQIYHTQLGSIEHVGGVGSGWHNPLWLLLCGIRETPITQPSQKHCKKHTLADINTGKCASNYVESALSIQSTIATIAAERPPTWEECNRFAEVFVYGILLWSHHARSDIKRLVVLARTRNLLFLEYVGSELAQESLQAAESRYVCMKSLLNEAVERESYFHVFTNWENPSFRRVHKEQEELALVIQEWWERKTPHLVFYEAPPASGKTTSVAFFATFVYGTKVVLQKKDTYMLYACHVPYVREHLRLHLDACQVPYAHLYAKGTDTSLFSVCTSLSKDVISCITRDKLLGLIDTWNSMCIDKRPLVLVCDLVCAPLISRQRPDDVMFLDEVCTTAYSHAKCVELVRDAPQFLVMLSSFMPLSTHMHEYVRIHEEKWPDYSVIHIRSRRPQPSLTCFLYDGSVLMPHNYGVSPSAIRRYPHLMRFYSSAALQAILEEEKLDPNVALDCGDLCSAQRTRNKCLQFVEDGIAGPRRSFNVPECKEEQWRSFVWRTACMPSDPCGSTLIYTAKPWECLRWGQHIWNTARDIPGSLILEDMTSDLVVSAMRKGIAVLTGAEDEQTPGLSSEYNAWVHVSCLKGKLVCVLADFSVLHGLHLPFTRSVFWDAPTSFEAGAHICGRVGRKSSDCNFAIYCKDQIAASVIMVPQEEPTKSYQSPL